jgi:NADH-dependent peroxiredoxin subunit F
MPVLDPALTAQLTQLAALIREPVVLAASLGDDERSAQIKSLLEEVAAVRPEMITVTDVPDARTPSFAIRRVGSDVAVRFAGMPLGHEFSSLVLALVQVGGHPVKADPELIEAIKALPSAEFVTYMSLTCQNCPTVVQALNSISVLNPGIRHTAVEGGAFPDEVAQRQVLAVPTVFRDGEVWGSGRMELAEIVSKLDAGTAARAAETIAAKEPFDVLVLGGGPAGAAAAIYAARKGVRTGLVADRIGGQVLETMVIENLISVPETEGPKLGAALEAHVRAYPVDVIEQQRASALVPAGDDGLIRIDLAGGGALRSRTVILATGASWRTLGVPGENEYRNKGVTFCPHCDGPLFAGKAVAVVGGGNSGIEAAIDLAGVVSHVTVVEFLDALKADDVLVRKARSLPNLDIILGAATTEVIGDGTKVAALAYTDRASGEARRLEVDGIFVQIGLLPNTSWLDGSGVALAARPREIVVDTKGATNISGVFAAGDCTTQPFKQIVISMGSGATAALGAFEHLIRTSAPAS